MAPASFGKLESDSRAPKKRHSDESSGDRGVIDVAVPQGVGAASSKLNAREEKVVPAAELADV